MSIRNINTDVSGCVADRAPSLIARLFSRVGKADLAIAIVFTVYAASFIFRSSFEINHTRYYSLFDDDMISMRYAYNLAHGYGMVWNPGGARVLGFTNLLWVLFMSFFHLLPISAAKVALCIQSSGALFLLLNLLVVGAICDELAPRDRPLAVTAMILTAFYGPLNNWALQGTEVSILTLTVSASIWLALITIRSEAYSIPLYILLGLSTLVRADMLIFSAALLLGITAMQFHRWRSHLIVGGAIIAAFVFLQGALNYSYYGNMLPNTYYLKMTGFPLSLRLRRGLIVAGLFLIPWVPLVVASGVSGLGKLPGRAWLLLTVTAAQVGYSIWVGGDAWEWYGGSNRYISIVMPLVLVLSAVAMVKLASRIRGNVTAKAGGLASSMGLAAITVIFIALINMSHFRNNFLLERPIQTQENEAMVRQALLLRNLTDEHAVVAVVWAGAGPYFAGREAVDLLGKNDPKIAREKMRFEPALMKRSLGFWPGHLKWDYGYSIGKLKPDIVLQLWALKASQIPSLTRDYLPTEVGGFTWYVRRDSPHFLWAKLQLDPSRTIASD
jgi:hypothetical protein